MSLTAAQEALLTALTDQRCANILESADFIHDLSHKQKDFLTQADPATLDFLRTLRPEEVKGLQAYLTLRSTSWYLAWAIGALITGLVLVLTLWNQGKIFLVGK
jgi:hypothetical protein